MQVLPLAKVKERWRESKYNVSGNATLFFGHHPLRMHMWQMATAIK